MPKCPELLLAAGILVTGSARAREPVTALLDHAKSLTTAYDNSGIPAGVRVVPGSNAQQRDGAPKTNLEVLIPNAGPGSVRPPSRDEIQANIAADPSAVKLPNGALSGETPASIACVYRLVPAVPANPACIPNLAVANPPGGGGTIAIVDTDKACRQ